MTFNGGYKPTLAGLEMVREIGRNAKDAARWRHCMESRFPVQNQDGRWVAFSGAGSATPHIHYPHIAATAEAAVDAAMLAQATAGDKA